MSNNEYLSNSRSYVYNRCKKMFDFKYIQKVKPNANIMHFESWERMLRGVMIHAAIEAGFLGQSLVSACRTKASQERARGLTEQQKTALAVMEAESPIVAQGLLDWLPASDWEPVQYRGKPMVEARLEWALPGWKGFLGFADLVAKHKPTGRILVLDWKSRTSFEDENVEIFNSQFLYYSYVLAQMGVPVDGSLLVELKPTTPKRAPRTIREDVGGINGIRVSEDGRYRSIPTFRSPEYLAAGWADFSKQAKVIASFKGEDAYRSMNAFNCKSCEFAQLCQGELQGHDLVHILKTSYSSSPAAIALSKIQMEP